MAFGFKKKKETADNIYMNGSIYTQDPLYPWATAVACKDGIILAVGDYNGMSEIIDDKTNIIDLDGKFMFPGFIETHDAPVLKIFDGKYLKLESNWAMNDILEMLSEYADVNDEADILFAYGFNENILNDFDNLDNVRRLLDEISDTRSILLLGENGVHVLYNTYAKNIIEQGAMEDCLEYITVSYIMNLLVPFNFDETEGDVLEFFEDLSDRGITSSFNMYAPEYFNDLFQDTVMALYMDYPLRQRFFGSLFVNRPINQNTLSLLLQNGQTACIEMKDYLNFNFLKLVVSNDINGAFFSQNALDTICLAIADKGFNIHADASDEESLLKIYKTFDLLRSKGYKKNILVIASEFSLDDNVINEFIYADTFVTTWNTDLEVGSVYTQSSTCLEAIDNYTIKAAEIIGASQFLGSIEKGKYADFTVFNSNPLELGLDQLPYMHAELTILNGEIVYDAEEAANDEMYNLLLSQQL